MSVWTPGSDSVTLAMGKKSNRGRCVFLLTFREGVVCCIRALGGYTIASSVDTVFDTDKFREKDYYEHLVRTSGNVALALNWWVAFIPTV